MTEVLDELRRLREAGELGVLVVVVEALGSTPAKAGARMIVRPDGSTVGTVGGGALEHHAIALAPEVLAGGSARLVPLHLARDLGMSCGGRTTLFFEPLGADSRLFLFGAGHISMQLCDMAGRCGFSVVVCDDRDELRTPARFPRATQLFASARASSLDALGIREHLDHAYVVVVTHSHELDFALVRELAPMGPVYLGMIGSRRKRKKLDSFLDEAGIDAEARDRIRCPAGLDLGGSTPAEIALSITAELVSVRAGRAAALGSSE